MSDSSDSEFDDLAAAIQGVGSEEEAGSDSESVKIDSSPKRRKVDPEEEKKLNKFLFGDKEGLLENLEGKKLFFTDVTGVTETQSKKESVWHDSDDEDHKKSVPLGEVQLKRKFERIAGNPSWAKLDDQVKELDSDDEDGISKTIGHIAKKTASKTLPKGELSFKRLMDVNKATMKEGRITSTIFHPKSTVGIVAGLKGMVSIFSIDQRENKKIHNIKYEKFPIYSCKLNNDGDEMTVGGNDPQYHTYNLLSGYKQKARLPRGVNQLKSFELSPCGKYMAVTGEFGEIHLLHSMTKELLCTLKQEYFSTSLNFSIDSTKLFSHSDDNEVTVFDIRTQRVQHRFVDDGCVNGTSLAISPSGKLIATGSRQGYVNIYNYEDVLASKYPKPVKALSNLSTEIVDVKFNPTNEMLAFCSSDTKNAVKLAHLPSATVFSNFPSQQDFMGQATTLAFSPAGGFFSIGSIGGAVPLYRLRHFSNY